MYLDNLLRDNIFSFSNLRQFILTWLLIWWGSILCAQDYNVEIRQWGIEDGLLHRKINSVFEDRDGFIWLTMPNGVQRFDGHELKTWSKGNEGDKVTDIDRIGQDTSGIIWLGFTAFYDPGTGKMFGADEMFEQEVPFTSTDKEGKGWSAVIGSFAKGLNGDFIFACNRPNRLYRYNPDSGFSYVPLDQLPNRKFSLFNIDSEGNLWIRTEDSVYKINELGDVLLFFDFNRTGKVYISKNASGQTYIHTMKSIDSNPEGFMVDEHGRLQPLAKNEKVLPQCGQSLCWSYEKNKLLIALKGDTSVIASLTPEDIGISSFYEVLSEFEDSRGDIWISTRFGLKQIIVTKKRFQKLLSITPEEKYRLNNSTRGIQRKGDTLFVSCERSGIVVIPLSDPENWAMLDGFATVGMDRLNPRALVLNRKGEQLYSGSTDRLRTYPGRAEYRMNYAPSNKTRTALIWSIYEEEENGAIWAGTTYGLWVLNKGESLFQKASPNNHLLDGIKIDILITQIVPAGDGTLWLASRVGLFRFDPQERKFLDRYSSESSGELWLPSSNIYHIYEDSDGIRWLGSDAGLIRWDPTSDEKRVFGRTDGLSNEVIYAILEDDYQQLWLSSDYGLMQFDKETFKVRAYLEKDGITHHEFNRTSYFKDEEGTIYFGGLNGVTAFHPADFQLKEGMKSPRMALSSFQKFDGATGKEQDLTAKLNHAGQIDLRPNDRYFRMKFALLTYRDVERINYAYRLEGIDEDWNYQSSNTLQLSKLPYGTHQLIIKGQDDSGVWSPNQLTYALHVIRPIYLRLWFILLIASIFISGVFLFFRQRTIALKTRQKELELAIEQATRKISDDKSTIESQAEELRKLDKLKSRFFANVSHELRTPLSLMLGPIRRLRGKSGREKEDIQLLGFLERNTVHLKGLVNEILELSKLENNKLDVKAEPTTLLPYLEHHLTQFYSIGNSEQVIITSAFSIPSDLSIMLDQNKFEKILNNYLSNALKFTPPNGQVSVEAKQEGQHLVIAVKDSGRGIHPEDLPHVFDRFYQSNRADTPAEGGTGIGLSLSKELGQLLGGEVWAESTLGKGSSFFLRLPIVQAEGNKKVNPQPVIDQQETITDSDTESAAIAKQDIRILVVEDNQDLREYYQIILSAYNVTLAENGQVALNILNTQALPDLIISDLMMPVMDGMQLLNALKSSDALRHLPVIMLTARTNRQDKIKALRFGIDDYLNKPFDEEELLVRIANLLKYSASRNEPLAKDSLPAPSSGLSQTEMNWLEELESYILSQLTKPGLSVANIAYKFAMSESTLLRQLKKLTGLTPNQYLREVKLNQAQMFLTNQTYRSVAEVAYQVGFKDPTSFTRSFKKRFGKAPTEMAL